MKWSLTENNIFGYLTIDLEKGDTLYVQPGSYLMHEGSLEIESKMYGGIVSALKRALLGGESIFLNKISTTSSARVYIAPYIPGEIKEIEIEGELLVRDSAFLALSGNMDVSAKFIGIKGIFTLGGMFWLSLKGKGRVWINAYGKIIEKTLKADEKITIDNGNLIAYEKSVNITTTKLGGMKTFLFGGEGVVFTANGPGKIYIQTRNLSSFVTAIISHTQK